MRAGSCCSLAAYALRSPKILKPAYHRRLWQGLLGPRASAHGPQMLWGMVGVATFIHGTAGVAVTAPKLVCSWYQVLVTRTA